MGKIIRWIVISGLAVAFVALLIFNFSKPVDHTDAVWDKNATVGNLDAKNYYIMYTDIACPYCSAFSRLIMENHDEFMRDYIEGKDILFEVRVTDMLYEYGEHSLNMSRDGAEAIFCAKDEGKFWEYYYRTLSKLWDDYHSKGIGVSKTSEPITDLPENYWLEIGEEVGLGKTFKDCVNNHSMLDAVKEATAKAWKLAGGMPYFKFNNFTTGGFDNNWGWDYVKRYLDSGLKK